MRDTGKSLRVVVCALAFLVLGTAQSIADGTFPGLLQPGQVLGNKGTSAAPAGPMYPLPQNAQLSNYTAVTSDCGKRIVFNVTAQVTLTLGAGSGYPANCDITVSNVGYYNGPGTARGVILSVSGLAMPDQGNALYPGQTTVFSSNGASSAWIETGYTQRQLWKPQNKVTFYVDCSAGSNTASDGLGTGSGANLTLAESYFRLTNFVDYSNGAAQAVLSSTGNCPAGDGIHMAGPLVGAAGGAAFVWNGNGTTTVNASGGSNCAALFNAAWIEIININCQSADSTGCFTVSWGARIFFAAPASTCNPGTGNGFSAIDTGSKIEFFNTGYNFGSASGLSGVNINLSAQNGGQIIFDAAETVTFLGNTTFSNVDLIAANGGQILLAGTTFNTGGFTINGLRFECFGWSILGVGTNPNSVIPGGSNGSVGPDCEFSGGALARSSFRSLSAGSLSGISSTSYKMLGLAGSITPTVSGNVLFQIAAEWFTGSAGDRCSALLAYGTGAAPSNGAAATGTTIGNALRVGYIGDYSTLPMVGYVTGLTPNTTYWFDLQIKSLNGGSCNLGAVNAEATEQ
jgi:hypothetical protein